MYKILKAKEAVQLIKNNDTVAIGGGGAGHAVPDDIMKALGEYYQETGNPKTLRVIHPCGIGDNDSRGLNHLAHEGLIETDIGGFWGNSPKLTHLAQQNKLKGKKQALITCDLVVSGDTTNLRTTETILAPKK